MTDGWGDASGIEGTTKARIADRFQRSERDGRNSGANFIDWNARIEWNEQNEPNEQNERNEDKYQDEWNGRTIYVPDGILDDMEDTYLESQLTLRKAGQNEFKKNRHFYPLLVQFGLEALSEADAGEIQTRLSKLGDE